jgi:hypothetical protein
MAPKPTRFFIGAGAARSRLRLDLELVPDVDAGLLEDALTLALLAPLVSAGAASVAGSSSSTSGSVLASSSGAAATGNDQPPTPTSAAANASRTTDGLIAPEYTDPNRDHLHAS